MKLGVIGWYGHGNAGDERILYAIEKYFESDDLIIFSSFENALTRIVELNTCDFVIIGGGGLILRGCNIYTELVESIAPPLACIGISIEAYSFDNKYFIESLKRKCKFIWVRDQQSKDLFKSYKCFVAPDLTFLYPLPLARELDSLKCSINYRDWKIHPGEYDGLADHLFSRIDKFIKIENIFPRRKNLKLKIISEIRNNFREISPAPLYVKGEKSDVIELSKFFDNTPINWNECVINTSGLVVAMRLHAIIFCTQMGIPFIAIDYQPKIRNFCNSIGMGEFVLPLNAGIKEIKIVINRAISQHIEVREHLRDVSVDLNKKTESAMDSIKNLIYSYHD